MLETNFAALLRCPEDRSELTPADDALIAEINSAVRAGRLLNRAGRAIDDTLDGGLVRAAGDVIYPIVDQIPILLREEGIELEQVKSLKAK